MAITALHTAATGMQALSSKIDVIANNIANAETPGFKASRMNFQDLLYQIRSQPGVQTTENTSTPLGTQIGLGVLASNTQIMFQQGSAMQGTNLDAMIDGDGFFQVELPGGGTGYTRAGNFVRNADGELVLGNSVGYRMKNTPTIAETVGNDQIQIGANGQISAIGVNGQAPTLLSQIQLARFPNPSGLVQYGGNIYVESAASGPPVEGNPGDEGYGTLTGGYLEQSTTEAVTELVELIKTQRTFQMNSQSIQTADQALQVVANLRR